MEIDNQIKLGHLLLSDRKCRVCGETKNLIDGFYLTRKDRGTLASAYSYEYPYYLSIPYQYLHLYVSLQRYS